MSESRYQPSPGFGPASQPLPGFGSAGLVSYEVQNGLLGEADLEGGGDDGFAVVQNDAAGKAESFGGFVYGLALGENRYSMAPHVRWFARTSYYLLVAVASIAGPAGNVENRPVY